MSLALPSLAALESAADRGVCLLAGRLADALRAGDAEAADRVVLHSLAAGLSPECVQSLVVARALSRVGEFWDYGVLTDEQAGHIAAGLARRSLRPVVDRLHHQAPSTGAGRRVLLAAPKGQRHVLGLQMAADVLTAHRYVVRNLGSDVAADALDHAVQAFAPDVVGLTFGYATGLEPLAEAICTIHLARPEARVMLGGRAVPPGLWNLGYPRVTSTVGLTDTVEQLLEQPPQRLPDEIRRLRSSRAAVPA